MLYKSFIGCAWLSIFFACAPTQHGNIETLLTISPRSGRDSLSIGETQKISIPTEKLSNKTELLLRPFVWKGKWLYAIERNKPHHRLVCIDMHEQKIIRAFDVTYPELKQEGISSFYVHSPDSIFFQASNSSRLVMLDRLGNVINSYETSPLHNFVLASFLPYQTGLTDIAGTRFFLTLIPVKFLGSVDDTFDQIPFQGVFDLTTAKLSLAYAPLEGIMKLKSESFYPPDLSLPYNLIIDERNFVNYPMDHAIYIYDVNTGALLDARTPAAKIPFSLSPPLPAELALEKQEIWNFRITTAFYEPLFYHSNARVFTRLVHFPQPLKINGQRLNTGEDRTSLLLILNENLECVGEHRFTHGQIPVHSLIPLPDGFLVQSDITSDSIHFMRYTFKKTNE